MGIKLYAWFETLKYSLRNQKGQGMVEYGLIISLIAIVCIAALTTVGTNIKGMFTNAAANIK